MGQGNDRPFGGGVVGHEGRSCFTGFRREVDDAAVLSGFHALDGGLAAVESAVDIDVKHGVQFVRHDLFKRFLIYNSGIVDQGIDGTGPPFNLSKTVEHTVSVRYIDDEGGNGISEKFQLLRLLFYVRVDVDHHYACTLRAKAFRYT
jgi:hypothetical protein